jgi:hypothetical protein
MRNITVAVSDDSYRQARIWAAKIDTSVSAVVQYLPLRQAAEEAEKTPTPPPLSSQANETKTCYMQKTPFHLPKQSTYTLRLSTFILPQTAKAPPEGGAHGNESQPTALQRRFNLKSPGFQQSLRDVLRVLVPPSPLPQTG